MMFYTGYKAFQEKEEGVQEGDELAKLLAIVLAFVLLGIMFYMFINLRY